MTHPKLPLPLERDIQKAIIDALWFKHRIRLAVTDAGGPERLKGVLINPPVWLTRALGLPQVLPFGLGLALTIPPSFSDTLGADIGSHQWIFVEVKRPGQKPRPDQSAFLSARRAEGHIAFWADSAESALRQFEEQAGRAA